MDNNQPKEGASTADTKPEHYRPGSVEVAGTDTSRRRLAKAGLAVPVIMSLSARPVWASNTGACSLSGDIFSANLSRIDDYECTAGQGCTPGFWMNNTEAWLCTGSSPGRCMTRDEHGNCTQWDAFGEGTTFSEVFGFAPFCNAPVYATLMEVLHTCNGSLDWHAVGAVLNAACNSIDYGATVQQVIDAYAKVRLDGLDQETLKDVFDRMNNRACPIDRFGRCESGFVLNETGQCIPVQTSQSQPS